MHTLERRKLSRYPYLSRKFFDPQLYVAELDPNQSAKYCAILATYPWFGIKDLAKYDSDKQKQKDWRKDALKVIRPLWPSSPPNPLSNPGLVVQYVAECIDFQLRIGCDAIILPGPLTHDSSSDFSKEIFWIDAGLEYLKKNQLNVPIYASVALVDNCLRYSDPAVNPLVDLVLDVVGSREIDGVYLTVEQASEPNDTRYMSNTRVIWSALHMTHLFKHDCGKKMLVNFFGPFGLVLEAAGAEQWATGWYKSLCRFRLADRIAGGLAYPTYWSGVALADISLDTDFDRLAQLGIVDKIADETPFSTGLVKAAKAGKSVKGLVSWQYRPNNIVAAQNHYLFSVISEENKQAKYSGAARLDYVEQWLATAVARGNDIVGALGSTARTKTSHIQSWLDAFKQFRRSQNL